MPATREPLRILVVDDDEDFLSLTREWLAAEPGLAFVGGCADGLSALADVARLQPDVVLVDVLMPGINGFETTRRLKARPGAPRVVMTSFTDSDSVRHAALQAGADAFLSKTDLTEELVTTLVGSSDH